MKPLENLILLVKRHYLAEREPEIQTILGDFAATNPDRVALYFELADSLARGGRRDLGRLLLLVADNPAVRWEITTLAIGKDAAPATQAEDAARKACWGEW